MKSKQKLFGAGRLTMLLAVIAAVLPGAAVGHILYTIPGGAFSHNSHTRNLYVYQGTSSVWSAQSREAQIQLDQIMNGSLRYNSTSHDNSVIHTVDAYYNTTWWGLAPNAGYHSGHGHVQLNLLYGANATWQQKRSVACHEMGHYSGLAHSDDATDCMSVPNFPIALGTAHRDQLRDKYNSTGH